MLKPETADNYVMRPNNVIMNSWFQCINYLYKNFIQPATDMKSRQCGIFFASSYAPELLCQNYELVDSLLSHIASLPFDHYQSILFGGRGTRVNNLMRMTTWSRTARSRPVAIWPQSDMLTIITRPHHMAQLNVTRQLSLKHTSYKFIGKLYNSSTALNSRHCSINSTYKHVSKFKINLVFAGMQHLYPNSALSGLVYNFLIVSAYVVNAAAALASYENLHD